MKTLNEQIERVRELLRKCYGVVASKNGIVPEVGERNMENLPNAIASTHDTLEELTITENGTYTPQEGVDGFSKVVARVAADKAIMISRGGELGNRTLFIDFDGTPLFAYEPEEILALEELPIPYTSHERLTFVKWNYTLEEIKERVQSFGWIDVGALYVPTNGWGEMEIEIKGIIPQFTPHFRMWLEDEGVLTIDWGDGTIEEYNGTDLDVRHTYTEVGKYLVRFISTTSYRGLYTYNDTKALVVGRFVFPTNATHVGANSANEDYKSGGNNPEENNASYNDPQCLAHTMVKTLVLPPSCRFFVDNLGSGLSFMPCLKSIVSDSYVDSLVWRGKDKSFPLIEFYSLGNKKTGRYNVFSDITSALFTGARSNFYGNIDSIKLAGGVYRAERITCPRGILFSTSNIGTVVSLPNLKSDMDFIFDTYAMFWSNPGITNMRNVTRFPITPSGYVAYFNDLSHNYAIHDYGQKFTTGSGNYFPLFTSNTSLQIIRLEQDSSHKSSIRANTFSNCYSLKEIHITYKDILINGGVSTLANVNAFSGCHRDLKIYVPAELVDAYRTATNWSTFADRIFAEPKVEPTE